MVLRNFARGKSCLSNELVLVSDHVNVIIRQITPIQAYQEDYSKCVKRVPRPVHPASWRWTCHQCDVRYSLAVTSRCLIDGHTFCSGQVVNKRTGATIKSKSCGSSFDYEGWERWDTWRGKIERLAEDLHLTSPTSPSPPASPTETKIPDRDCYSRCRFPSECRWGARPGSAPKRPLIRKRKATTLLMRSPTTPTDPSIVIKQGVRKSSISTELTHEFNKKIRLTIDSTETTRIKRRKSSGSSSPTSPDRIVTERTTTASIAAAARRGLIVKSRKTKFKLLKPPQGKRQSMPATILEKFMFSSEKRKKVESIDEEVEAPTLKRSTSSRTMRSFFGSSKPAIAEKSDAMDVDDEEDTKSQQSKEETGDSAMADAHPGTQLLFPLLSF